jgi:diadenosine tetraphosphate (Ap4A) HIT family hydrolase
MSHTRWDDLARGIDCPFDAPRPGANEQWDLVAALSVSSLYLSKNQTYRGHCQLVFDSRHATRLDQLSGEEWRAFADDLFKAQAAVMRAVRPDHINIESLGNIVPHLHWHIVPRYKDDLRWGSPIWLTSLADMADTPLLPGDRDALLLELRMTLRWA